MLTRVGIENFQSIEKLDIELGKFTVIVGPSSSGKTAFLRAIKLLVSNARGKTFIRHGATQCAVIAARDNGTMVAIGRGSKDHYIVAEHGGPNETYTKLGGAVPEQVSEALRIQPVKGTSLNFAGQFDRPYLLDDSGADVAKTLGELTKVTRLFDAAREANRRKLAASSELRTRESDLAGLTTRVQQYLTLPDRLRAATEAESLAEQAVNLANQQAQLAQALQRAQVARSAVAQAEQALATLPTPVDIPVDALAHKLAELQRLRQAVGAVLHLRNQIALAEQSIHTTASAEQDARDLLAKYLAELGHCPTCGAASEHMHPESLEV